MSSRMRWGLFLLVALSQLGICGWMIGSRQLTLAEGHPYKLRTAPVDPYDPFQGRYAQLRIEGNPVEKPKEMALERGQVVYVPLTVAADGFARLDGVRLTPPEAGDYVRATVRYSGSTEATLELPFERYYANEKLAPEIERAYWQNSRRDKRNAYILIHTRGGQAVLEELFIDELPVREFLRRQAAASGDAQGRE